ncbi:hypothetical protein GIB67_002879 [Kingdonia uniflora]|uniref:Uncharacterized protein n=1 Tax=Kingdonia uniflora TaxID=39325 RepID=A0A7J7NQZ8_9MAGN|nr:hypothetical protein GIB67_002879 [Kingdonia uniflora]
MNADNRPQAAGNGEGQAKNNDLGKEKVETSQNYATVLMGVKNPYPNSDGVLCWSKSTILHGYSNAETTNNDFIPTKTA